MLMDLGNLQSILQDAIEYLVPLLPLANSHMVDFITCQHWETLIPAVIREDVKSKPSNIGNEFIDLLNIVFETKPRSSQCDSMNLFPNVEHFISSAREVAHSISSTMLTQSELLKQLLLMSSCSGDGFHLDQFMSSKKAYEVDVMAKVVDLLATVCKTAYVVDVGSGKGYLSSMLALHHKLCVLGIDSSQTTSHGAAKRTKKLLRVWNGISKKERSSTVPNVLDSDGIKNTVQSSNRLLTASKTTSANDVQQPSQASTLQCVEGYDLVKNCLYKQATIFVTPDMNLLNIVNSYFSDCEKCENLTLVGLHTCGNLAPSALRIFSCNEEVQGLCIVGCCYHLLNEEFDMEISNTYETSNLLTYGFPMSMFLRSKQFRLGRNARMLASQSLERTLGSQLPSLDALFYRALLQVLLKGKLEDNLSFGHVGRLAAKCNNFSDYTHKALKKLGLEIEVTEEELEVLFSEHAIDRENLAAFYVLRLVLAPVIEGIIKLDQLIYLREQGIDAHVVKLFDPLLSPRCYGIVALKNQETSK